MKSDHGDDRYRYPEVSFIADFSSNVPHLSITEGLWQHLSHHKALINRYPEPKAFTLERKIAERRGISADEILVTNGATEAIYLISHLFAGTTSYIPQPTFSEYAHGATAYRHTIINIGASDFLDDDVALPREGLVWLCNPNNPTGLTYEHDRLFGLIASSQHLIFVLDQSYADFTSKQVLSPSEITSLPNCIAIQSLTKSYAIPGLRLGYVMASKELILSLSELKVPWSVNALALEAGCYLLSQPFPFDLKELLEERKRWVGDLLQLDVMEIYPTDTHYFYAQLKHHKASDLKNWLAYNHRILIRDASTFPTLTDRYIRLATQSREHNDLLIQALTELPTTL